MSLPTGPRERPGTAPRSVEERYRDLGLTVLQRLTTLIRLARAYQLENQVVHRQIQEFLGLLNELSAEQGEAVVVFLDSDCYLNGFRIPVRANTLKFHQAVLKEFEARQIAGIRAERGLELQELIAFFGLFVRPDLYYGATLLEACIAQGCDHILPAIHASTESPEGADTTALGSLAQMSFFHAGLRGSAATRDGDLADPAAGLGAAAPGSDEAAGGGAPRGAAPKSFNQALVGARSLLTTTSVQRGIEMRHAKRVVQPLVDGAFATEPVVVGLTTLGRHDEYTYAHAVNVTLVAVSMGHYLQMDRRALADLGAAALLHDVGKAAMANRIKNRLEDFTPEEHALAARHPVEGARLLAQSTTLNPTTLRVLRVALEHHAHADGTGYPAFPTHWRVSMLSRLVAVADCFVSLQTHRSERGAKITPYDALGMMLGPLSSRFDPALLWALVQTLGFYPPGQLVELSDGTIAIVLAPNPDDLARPHARRVADGWRRPLPPEQVTEMHPIPPELSVRRALGAEDYASLGKPREAA